MRTFGACLLVSATALAFGAAARPSFALADETDDTKPATVAQAAELLDLAKFPLVEGAAEPKHRRLAALVYNAPGTVKQVFQLELDELAKRKWQPAAEQFVSPQMASATLRHESFSLALSVLPTGKPDVVTVAITHLGNVDAAKLPVPGQATLIFPGSASAGHITNLPVEEALKACRESLAERGWQPYGSDGETLIYKQNAVRVTLRATPVPKHEGQSLVSYSVALMSADLPAPPDAENVHYDEETMALDFDTTTAPAEISSFYSKAARKAGWRTPQAVTRPIRPTWENERHERVTLEISPAGDKNHVQLKIAPAPRR